MKNGECFPFPTEEAKEILKDVFERLREGSITLNEVTSKSPSRKTEKLMIGCMTAKKSAFSAKRFVLLAVSGLHFTLESTEQNGGFVFVPPVVSAKTLREICDKTDKKINKETRKSKIKKLYKNCVKEIFSRYSLSCADEKRRNILEITRASPLPPVGTGECAEIKLLHFAFSHRLIPVSMAQAMYTFDAERRSVECVPPCASRCGRLLPEILRLKILYKDESIVVIDKPSSLLCVPGRTEDKQDSILTRLRRLYPECSPDMSVHRLDMETSGVMVFALTKQAKRSLSFAFERREVRKQYVALLDGVVKKERGKTALFYRVDLENRPKQMWDIVNGKLSVTEWERLDVERLGSRLVTRVLFTPLTGRTHQLRLASADRRAIGCPIVNDSLYSSALPRGRMMLHAWRLGFAHPESAKWMSFESAIPF